jgi:hypothetical protein
LDAQKALPFVQESAGESATESQAQHRTHLSAGNYSFHGVKQHPTPRGNHCDSNPHLVPGKVDGKQYMVNDDETVAQICVKLMVRLPLPPIVGIRST